ncbi:MAG: von willebrand factor type a [Planctomycetaceae bacterium]|nr:von willebrand factor type a [Planctomycetaceae bacterium]
MRQSYTGLMVFCTLLAFVNTTTAKQTEVVITVEKKVGPEISTKTPLAGTPFTGKRAAVDVAILLDTSNSMDGLIHQAKSQLWTIVQQFAKAKKHGQTPILRVALFEYGNTRLPAAEGYIRQVVPLTDNLDKLSQALFALSTKGGDEYCGQVLEEATKRLDWSQEPNAYKTIFIAGNEPFTQGPVDYRESCDRAIQSGIIINTIHCGNHTSGVDGQWQAGAQLAEGEFFNIDQDRAVVQIKCPQDKIILQLNAELNKTYLWYGDRKTREHNAANQLAQDSNASSAGESIAVGRAVVKSGKMYGNKMRCLVDTIQDNENILTEVDEDQLPEVLRVLEPEKRKAYVNKLSVKRSEVQKKIAKLAAERENYLIQEHQRIQADKGQATLGDVVVAAITKQLAKSGFETTAESK